MKNKFSIKFKKIIFILGCIYSCFYLISCITPYVSPKVWDNLTFFSLLFPPLLAGMLIWLFIVIIFFRKRSWIFLILLFAGYQNIFACFGFTVNNNFVQQKKPNTIRILSWNVQDFLDSQLYTDTPGNKRRDIIAFIKNANADIVCLQDFTQRESPAFRNCIIDVRDSGNLPYNYFNIDYLTRYSDITTKYGTAIFSKFPIIDSGKIAYTGRKISESLEFADVKIGSDTLRVFNTHLQSMYLKFKVTEDVINDDFINNDIFFLRDNPKIHQRLKHYDKRHTEQANVIKPALNNCKFPFIFCADLNSVPSSYTYHTLCKGLTDAFIANGLGLGGTYDGFSPTLRIDVILMSKQLKPVQYYSPQLHASDHFPVITDIQLH